MGGEDFLEARGGKRTASAFFLAQHLGEEQQGQGGAGDFHKVAGHADLGEPCKHPVEGIEQEAPERADGEQGFEQSAVLPGGGFGGVPFFRAGFFDEERRDDGEQQYQEGTGINQDVVVPQGPYGIRADAEGARDGLHPGISFSALRPFGGDVGDDGAGGVKADVDRKVQQEGYGDGHAEDTAHAQGIGEHVNIGQGEEHEAGEHAPDEDERPAASVPEPHPVADESDDELAEDTGDRACGPDEADFFDVELVFGAQDPAQGADLHGQREPHGGGGEA